MKDDQVLELVRTEQLQFSEVLIFIENNYSYSPSGFKNGNLYNSPSENQGSARILFLGQINRLTKEDTLMLFGEHYRSVRDNPAGEDHQNIRQFMKNGWYGVKFDQDVLRQK